MEPPAKRIHEKTSTDLKAGNSSEVLPVKIIELINQRFAKQAELITSNMRGMEDRIMGILNERLTSMGVDMRLLTQRVEQLQREKLNALREELSVTDKELPPSTSTEVTAVPCSENDDNLFR
ncbi:hypothetical protein ACLKA6_009736 [Drosophila palustris]